MKCFKNRTFATFYDLCMMHPFFGLATTCFKCTFSDGELHKEMRSIYTYNKVLP